MDQEGDHEMSDARAATTPVAAAASAGVAAASAAATITSSGTNGNSADRHVISDKELSECDREKLHLIGHTQGGAGHTLFVDYPGGNIVACDANISAVPWIRRRGDRHPKRGSDDIQDGSTTCSASAEGPTDSMVSASGTSTASASTTPKDLIGSSLQSWLPSTLYQDIIDSIDSMKKARSKKTFLFYEYRSDAYAISLSTTSRACSIICVEIEDIEDTEATGEFYNTLVSLGRVMEFYADERVIKNACDTVFKLLGQYDRGMVYQFMDDNSGEVIYEIKKDHVTTSYAGMRFPATDIPLSARKLYILNGLRYIENVEGEAVPIISKGPVDLSHCRMRAVSKPHIVYLRNMGIVTSLSVAIVVEGELWGLLAYHGYSKTFKPSLHQRIACETINSMVSVKVESIMKKAQSVRVMALSEILIKWDSNGDVTSNLTDIGGTLLHALDCDVLVARVGDAGKKDPEVVVLGDKTLVPGDAFWDHFSALSSREIYAADTRKAVSEMGLSEEVCPACGIAYYRDRLLQVMLGRGLRSKDVMWAGNPDEPKLRIGGILCPRNSFAMFMEKARKETRSWSTSDLHVFQAFMFRICEYSHSRMMTKLKSSIEEANVKYFNAIGQAKENCEFFAQMSHEIRTPFHGVMGCLNILHDSLGEMAEDEIQDMINTALSSGNHMINLLNDILSLSKNRHLNKPLDEDKLRYIHCADETLQGLKSLAVSQHVSFNCEFSPPDENLVVVTDKTKILQIVSNIVNNAIKFSPGGSVSVGFLLAASIQQAIDAFAKEAAKYAGTVYTMEENQLFDSVDAVQSHVARMSPKADQKWMLVSVTDSGCGMRSNELAEMLQPYTQSSRGSNRIFQGTGLGLFICVSLCQHLHGFLACSSTPGDGTVFHIGIPIKVEVIAIGDEISDSPEKVDSNPSKPIPMSGPIAVCDDNVVNVKILRRGLQLDLKNQGIDLEVLTADGGNRVVELYKEKHPSLLFIDYHMPDGNGDDATKQIRQYEAEKGMKPSYIIIYTADLTNEATTTLMAAGSNEVMPKPPPKGFIADILKRMVLEEVDG